MRAAWPQSAGDAARQAALAHGCLLLGLFVWLLTAAGCRRAQPVTPAPAERAVEAEAEAAGSGAAADPLIETTRQYRSTMDPIAPQQQPVAERVAEFTWTDQPTSAMAPDQPVTGRLAGRDFIARYVSVAPDEEDGRPTLRLRFSNRRPENGQCSFLFDDDAVFFEWHAPNGVGTLQRRMNEQAETPAAAWFTLEQPDGTPLTNNTPWAAALRLEEERGPTQTGGVSSLRGSIVLVFDDRHKSWIAGTFIADGCADETHGQSAPLDVDVLDHPNAVGSGGGPINPPPLRMPLRGPNNLPTPTDDAEPAGARTDT